MDKSWRPKKYPNTRLRKGTITTDGHPLKVDALFKAVVNDLGLNTKAAEFSILALWQDVIKNIAPQFAQSTRAIKVIKDVDGAYLAVEAHDATVASNLQFYLPEITVVLNDYSSQTGLTLAGIRLVKSGL